MSNSAEVVMLRLRPGRREDRERLAEVERDAGERFRAVGLDAVADGSPSAPDLLDACLDDGAVVVAVAAGRPVGFALAAPLDGAFHLHELSVRRSHGRRGLGARLVAAVAEAARTRGLSAVTLATFVDVPWNAPFYAGLGFHVVAPAAWTPTFHVLRTHEAAVGLDTRRRVFMRCPLG